MFHEYHVEDDTGLSSTIALVFIVLSVFISVSFVIHKEDEEKHIENNNTNTTRIDYNQCNIIKSDEKYDYYRCNK